MSENIPEDLPISSGEIPKAATGARFSHVLRNRNFLLIWLSQLVSQLADRFLLYVLLIFAYQATKSNLGVSLPMLAFGIPSVLFGPGAGVLVDRFDRKILMVISALFRGLLILAIIPFVDQSIIFVFLISFVVFSFTQVFAPAETACIPGIVEKRDLIAANSLFMMTLMGASIIGIGLAAPLTTFFGNIFVLIFAAILHFISSAATFLLTIQHRPVHKKISVAALFEELIAGLKFIFVKPVVSYALLKMLFATSVLATISLLAVSYSEQVLKIGAENFGYLVFSAGIGMVVGALFLGHYSHYFKKGWLVTFGFLSAGVVLLLLANTENLWVVLVLIFVLGLGNAFITAPLQTILHEHVPPDIRGRVFGVQHMIINSAFTFPVVLFGKLADVWGLRPVIALLGVLVLLGGFFDRFISKFKDI
ncbi:MAG: MFS transporter [Candidatus Margulisbacteria bacterium]|nr:MFS transporter [Candidatus Margulisiibacteriota bacterium]MBU1021214.1 MFS transporter [Candidatus Margulisiibacteriota bacterium]MBU1729820.1 MFS transporter [Candidatus Margulisiibacteriota bacterium]MBU1955321.1 MFS transporter [Candidatus Margulisiibacteriota bacterium]